MDVQLFAQLLKYEDAARLRIEHVKHIAEFAPTDSVEQYISFIIQTIADCRFADVSEFNFIINELISNSLIPHQLTNPEESDYDVPILSFATTVKQTIQEMKMQGKLQVIGGIEDQHQTGGISEKVYLLIDQPAPSTVS